MGYERLQVTAEATARDRVSIVAGTSIGPTRGRFKGLHADAPLPAEPPAGNAGFLDDRRLRMGRLEGEPAPERR